MHLQLNRLLESFNNALRGLIHAIKTQRNMQIHFIIAFLVLVVSLFFDLSKLELVIIFMAIVFVIAMELVNTAIEVIIDMISEEYRFQAKIAKNMAAGAVLLASINALVLAYFLFLDDLNSLNFNLINIIRQKPAHLTFVNISLLVVIILILKARHAEGTPLKGGMPSGHSALAFCFATIISLLTSNVLVTTLVFLLALLVVQSRLESQTHTFFEVLIGALIGFFLTLLIFQFM